MDARDDDTVTLLLVIVGVVLIMAMIGVPLVKHYVAAKNPQVTVVAAKGCAEGTACESCVDHAGTRTCFPGVCDASGNCLVQARAPPHSGQERGLRAMVFS
jgi:hypothetical protein